ncbi:MAG TPA: nucleoside:proton symporter [Alphaproteobacteria bacterium]|nr:nucleoside:proton symporter [Alphaproteobacteria bacterium]HBC53875.1 nucleoside:proton symporter [Alphaproteobacteria bacterium]
MRLACRPRLALLFARRGAEGQAATLFAEGGSGGFIYHGIIGLAVLIGLAWLLSEARARIRWRYVIIALVSQFVIALILLRVPFLREGFLALNGVVRALSDATRAGTSFVFGYLGGGAAPFTISDPAASFILGLQALPLILVMSALSALLWHWRVLPWVIRGFAWALRRSLALGGAAGVAAAANIFAGMVEAPLMIRPYLMRMRRSELFVLMSVGMATVAGTMMVLYATILAPVIPGALGHILTASVISLPAAILIAQIMIPDADLPAAPEAAQPVEMPRYGSAMDAVTVGTQQGLVLLANVIAMLIVLVALVALVNLLLSLLPEMAGAPLSLQRLLGWLFAPLVWCIGIPWEEAMTAGALMGTKTVLNELIAYLDLVGAGGEKLSPQSRLIMVYALCGFANFGSLGIMIGGLSGMVPERRGEIAQLGLRSIVAGSFATLMTGAVVGLIAPAEFAL